METFRYIPATATKSAINLYIREISQIPLLSIEEEQVLNQRLKQAREKIKQLAKNKGMKTELIEAENELKKIENIYIEGNLRLVFMIVKKHYSRLFMSLEDKIQLGNEGLHKAIKKFDPDRGTRFSSYANWWVKRYIKRGHDDTSHIIRIPVHAHEKKSQLKKRKDDGSQLTTKQQAEYDYIEQIQHCISLESQIKNTPEKKLTGLLKDDNSPSPEENMIKKETTKKIHELLKKLPSRTRYIIEAHYGITRPDNDEEGITLADISKKLNLSHERIRQIRNETLEILKQSMAA
jgi:RNA polymerase sigma factor (sigma-70 family)